MVRRFPTDENRLINPAVSLSLFAVGMAAAIAMVTMLCGMWSRRKSPELEASSPSAAGNDSKQDEKEGEQREDGAKELPLPPKMQQVENSVLPSKILKSASERKLNQVKSMSMKVPRSLSVVKTQLEEGIQKRKDKLKADESIWTKTIILGEKCKVSEEEDGVIYEGKGKKVSAYHPRAPMPISRKGSAIDDEALPKPEPK